MSYKSKNMLKGECKMNDRDGKNNEELPFIGLNRGGSEVRLAESKDRFNEFVAVSGQSGSGKTTFSLNLVCEYADVGKNVVILDGHGSCDMETLPETLRKRIETKFHSVNLTEEFLTLPLWNCLSKNGKKEDKKTACRRLGDALGYAAKLTSMEKSSLLEVLELMDEEGLYQEKGISSILDVMPDVEKKELKSAEEKLYSMLHDLKIQDGNFFASNGGLWKVDLNDLSYDAQSKLIEFLLFIIYEVARTGCFKETGLILYVDEAQMLRYDKNSILRRYIQEGRKLGVGLIISTPVVSNKLKNGMEVLLDCDIQIHFAPGENAEKIAKKIDAKEQIKWTYRLKQLRKGEYIACGSFMVHNRLTVEPQRLHMDFGTIDVEGEGIA